MFDRRLRFTAALLVLGAIPAGSLAAGLRLRPAPAAAAREAAIEAALERSRPHVRTRNVTDCTVAGSGGFKGGGANNIPGGANSGILSGQNNQSCDQLSAIGAGEGNTIYSNGGNGAEDSFIGAGSLNTISSYGSSIVTGTGDAIAGTYSTIGAGHIDDIAGNHDFIGAGDYNQVSGSGSAIVSGGYQYFLNGGMPFGNVVSGRDSFMGAGDQNLISGNGSVIGGGDYIFALNSMATGSQVSGNDSFLGAGDQNVISGDEGFIGSGLLNVVSNAPYAAISAGQSNEVDGPNGFIGAGYNNRIAAAAMYASVLGGGRNSANGTYSSVLAGFGNTASGQYAVVAGGNGDSAVGMLSFAAGYHASAAHAGSFVWSDYSSGSAKVADAANNQFVVRASGGVFFYSNEATTAGVQLAAGSGTWSSLSDRNAKTDTVPIDDEAVLAKVSALPITGWRYRSQKGVRHVGPMAQDFYAAFGVGDDDRHIASIDEDGVALAAVKAVNAKLDRENATLRVADRRRRDEIAQQRGQISALRADVVRIEAEFAALRRR